jgi:hypothetical protein
VKKFSLHFISPTIPAKTPATVSMRFVLLRLIAPIFLLCLLSPPALPQRSNYPTPPTPLSTGDPQPIASPVNSRRQIDLVKLQQEADELSQTAQTIPADVTSIRHAMLPKDILQKLKRIEKLSKHLRRELTP